MTAKQILLILACAALAAYPSGGVAAQATPYVAAFDLAYHDLDALISAGLVRNLIDGERPHSRAAFGRFVREAEGRLREGSYSPRILEAWARLDRRFGADDEGWGSLRLRPTPTRVDLAISNSPSRPLRPGVEEGIDGAVNPLLQRNGGRTLADGVTLAVESGLRFSGAVAGELSPRVFMAAPRGADDVEVEADVIAAYARTLLGPLALEAGRLGVTWGHGSGGGVVLSNNARGVDMVRFVADRPVHLPGALGGLGLWRGSLGLGTLGGNRDVAGAKIAQARLGWRPHRHVELGFGYLNIQGGEGAPEATLWNRVRDFLLFPRTEAGPDHPGGLFEISDKVVGLDLRVSLPGIRSAVYADFLTTDDRGLFQQPARGYWQDAVWLVGLETTDLGPGGRLAATLEWRHAGARAHAHGQFTSGVTLDGRVMGDPLGPNASGVTAGLDWTGPASRVRVRGAWERYSGDRWSWDQFNGDDGSVTSSAWYRVADEPDELRRRVVVDWVRLAGAGTTETSVRLGYERVTRFDYGDRDRDLFLARATLRYFW